MYTYGQGIPQNLCMAMKWITLSERHGNPAAGRLADLPPEARHLRYVLESDGSTIRAVLKNRSYNLFESHPDKFDDIWEAENFVTEALLTKLLEAFPDAVNL